MNSTPRPLKPENSVLDVANRPERSGVPSGVRGVGADRFGFPSGVRGIPGVWYVSHWAASGPLSTIVTIAIAEACTAGSSLGHYV